MHVVNEADTISVISSGYLLFADYLYIYRTDLDGSNLETVAGYTYPYYNYPYAYGLDYDYQ